MFLYQNGKLVDILLKYVNKILTELMEFNLNIYLKSLNLKLLYSESFILFFFYINRFVLPHGLEVDSRGNVFVTDVALHQVSCLRTTYI